MSHGKRFGVWVMLEGLKKGDGLGLCQRVYLMVFLKGPAERFC